MEEGLGCGIGGGSALVLWWRTGGGGQVKVWWRSGCGQVDPGFVRDTMQAAERSPTLIKLRMAL